MVQRYYMEVLQTIIDSKQLEQSVQVLNWYRYQLRMSKLIQKSLIYNFVKE